MRRHVLGAVLGAILRLGPAGLDFKLTPCTAPQNPSRIISIYS